MEYTSRRDTFDGISKEAEKIDAEEGRALLDHRKHDIEPTFGHIKHNMGFCKILLRRLPKVVTEVGLIAIAHNLKKVKGWLGSPEMMAVTG